MLLNGLIKHVVNFILVGVTIIIASNMLLNFIYHFIFTTICAPTPTLYCLVAYIGDLAISVMLH